MATRTRTTVLLGEVVDGKASRRGAASIQILDHSHQRQAGHMAFLAEIRRILLSILKIVGLAALLVLVLLAEDTLLWDVPRLTRRWSARDFPARCSEVTAGMTREDVLTLLHRDVRLAAESESTTRTEFGPVHRLQFSAAGGIGTCTVDLDPVQATVTSARFDPHSREGQH